MRGKSKMADYDFDAMELNLDHCIKVIKGDTEYLNTAFVWSETPQGREYWKRQLLNGIEPDAMSTLAYMAAQGLQFEMMRSGFHV
jgi:hypothetical protein